MASMLGPSSTALVSASTMQNRGISILPASLLPGLSGSFPFILLGKMEKAKSWQNPIRKTPVFMEAVLNKFYRSMEAEVDPSTSTSTWKIHSSLCFTLGIVYPVHFAQQSLSSHCSVVALPNQPRVPSEARVPQRIRPATFWFPILQSL